MRQFRILLSVALLLSGAAVAHSQNMYDAMAFSRNDYYGSARSMALGNAVTAVGGDLGSIGINPAGSAVATYGQFVLTPGLSISSVNSGYSSNGYNTYSQDNHNTRSRMNMPNLGCSFVFNTGNRTGLKSFTLAIVYNQTAQYNNYAQGYGANPFSSKTGEFAYSASGIDEAILREYRSFDNSNVSWDILTAYQAGMFGSYGAGNDYIAVSEALSADGSYIFIPAPLNQTAITNKIGSKGDLVLNFGANISDNFFIGFNLGIPSFTYKYNESFYETASNPELFPITYAGEGGGTYSTYFKSAYYGYRYYASGAGVYAKLGFIATPMENLRIGAAIQTPTLLSIDEKWQNSASTSYSDRRYDNSASSPEGDYDYTLRTPYSVNFGIAYTFDKFGLISLDYELTDYSVMKFSEIEIDDYFEDFYGSFGDPFNDLNRTNKNFAGVSHSLRIGAEFRPTSTLSIRAGYGVTTSPEKYWLNNTGAIVNANDYLADFDDYFTKTKYLKESSYYGDKTRTYSLGLGYSSYGSFFADFAIASTKYTDTLFSPYYDYDCFSEGGEYLGVSSPKMLSSRSLWQVALTVGWRF